MMKRMRRSTPEPSRRGRCTECGTWGAELLTTEKGVICVHINVRRCLQVIKRQLEEITSAALEVVNASPISLDYRQRGDGLATICGVTMLDTTKPLRKVLEKMGKYLGPLQSPRKPKKLLCPYDEHSADCDCRGAGGDR